MLQTRAPGPFHVVDSQTMIHWVYRGKIWIPICPAPGSLIQALECCGLLSSLAKWLEKRLAVRTSQDDSWIFDRVPNREPQVRGWIPFIVAFPARWSNGRVVDRKWLIWESRLKRIKYTRGHKYEVLLRCEGKDWNTCVLINILKSWVHFLHIVLVSTKMYLI